MRFGLRLIQYLGTPRRLVELAVLAEEAGFDSVWFPHDAFLGNSWVLTAAAAEHTSEIQIGSVGTNSYLTNPVEIATYIATLDELSGGRAVLGLGLHTTEMVEWTGLDASDHVTHTREATEIIRSLLRGEVVDYRGEVFSWTDQCYLRFRPYRPEIPIYIAAFGSQFLALSGEIGDGSLPMITPPEAASYMVPAIRAGLSAAGRHPSQVDIAGCAWLSLSESRAEATDVLRQMISYFGPYLEEPALETVGLQKKDFDRVRELMAAGRHDEATAAVTDDMFRLAISGSPKHVIEQIEHVAALGVTHVNLGGPLGPDPAQAIRLMGDRVIPHFREGGPIE